MARNPRWHGTALRSGTKTLKGLQQLRGLFNNDRKIVRTYDNIVRIGGFSVHQATAHLEGCAVLFYMQTG